MLWPAASSLELSSQSLPGRRERSHNYNAVTKLTCLTSTPLLSLESWTKSCDWLLVLTLTEPILNLSVVLMIRLFCLIFSLKSCNLWSGLFLNLLIIINRFTFLTSLPTNGNFNRFEDEISANLSFQWDIVQKPAPG